MAAFTSWIGTQLAKPMVRSATQMGTKIIKEAIMEGASDVMSSKVKENTGVTMRTPPPSTPAAVGGMLAYNAGKLYVA